MPLTHVDDLLNQAKAGTSNTAYTITPDWGQGRASFGGLLGGMLYTAMRREMSDNRPLYSLMVSFVGPVVSDEPFTMSVQILRIGKSAVQVAAQMMQNDSVVCSALACFGTARESSVLVASLPAPRAPAPDTLPALPYIPNVVPAFTQHIDFRWAFGGLPFSGTPSREMGGWMRLKDLSANDEFTTAHLITLIDAWPPAVLPLLSKPAPASSVTWSMSFMQPLPELTSDWWLYRAEIAQAADGYGQTCAHIWDKEGALVAISTQTVAVFDTI
jgi:acyl-CoA thioesterase